MVAAAPQADVDEPRPVARDRRLAYLEGPRALAEFGSLLSAAPYLRLAPRGDGHPVLVLPGFGGGDLSTAIIRRYLSDQGFAAGGWTLGRNLGPALPELLPRLAARLEAVWRTGGERRVSLVGWSLGGLYGRWLAQHYPERVRQVVSLGSPIGGRPQPSRAYRIMQATSRADGPVPEVRRDAAAPLRGVPSTAIYSRTDGIVPWQIARQPPSPIAENVEVHGSHIGLGCNPSVLYLLAERLAQPPGAWRRFEPRGWQRWIYRLDIEEQQS